MLRCTEAPERFERAAGVSFLFFHDIVQSIMEAMCSFDVAVCGSRLPLATGLRSYTRLLCFSLRVSRCLRRPPCLWALVLGSRFFPSGRNVGSLVCRWVIWQTRRGSIKFSLARQRMTPRPSGRSKLRASLLGFFFSVWCAVHGWRWFTFWAVGVRVPPDGRFFH